MRRIYYEVKRRFLPDVPISEILLKIDKVLSNKDGDTLPANVIAFPWYDIGTTLFRGDGLFFRADDTIILDLTSIDMGVVETTFAELPLTYWDDIYPTLRMRTYEVEARSLAASPMPEFIYDSSKSNIKDRVFHWNMTVDFVIPDGFVFEDTYSTSPNRIKGIPQKGVKSDEIRLKELELKSSEAQIKRNEQRKEEFDRIERMFTMGVITKEQFNSSYDEIFKAQFNKGGDV